MVSTLELSLQELQTQHDFLKLQQQKVACHLVRGGLGFRLEAALKTCFLAHRQAAVTVEDKERLLAELQKKVASLERRLQGDLSQDQHLLELLQEVSQTLLHHQCCRNTPPML